MTDLSGRVALVTGGSRGIGRAIAWSLAEAGADVAIVYRRDEAAAKETIAGIERHGVKARAYRASVDSVEECRRLAAAAAENLGGIGVLVHSAGVASRGGAVADTHASELARVMGVHAFGAHHICQAVLPWLRRGDRGDIVLISSAITSVYPPYGAPYSMAKAAMEALAHTLAKEERGNGVHVNIVAPGLVDTEMGRRLVKATMGVEDIRERDAASPFGHVCSPEEVAQVVRFLVSAGYVTDQRVVVDGGTF
jgi:3-oxoacyl-[acyl-carrier protein] reductase